MQVDDAQSIPNRFLLFVGGDERSLDVRVEECDADVVVAADSGLHVATALGARVDHVIGDMDSVDAAALAKAEAGGAIIHVHPADKNATDLELALDLVLSLGGGLRAAAAEPHRPGVVPALHVVGGGGGRLDHLIGDTSILSSPRLVGWEVTARFGDATLAVVRPGRPVSLRGQPGEQLSLLPFHGDVAGASTAGLRWPLVDGFLAAGTSRAISNEFEAPVAEVSITAGSLVVVQPGTRGAVAERRPDPYDPTPRPPTTPTEEPT